MQIREHQDLFWEIGLGLLLLFNLILSIIMINKISDLQQREILQLGGAENADRLHTLYQDPSYQHYFKNEIDLLEKKLQQLQKTVQPE